MKLGGIVCFVGLHDRVRLVCDWAGLGGRGGDDVHDSKEEWEQIKYRSTLNIFGAENSQCTGFVLW